LSFEEREKEILETMYDIDIELKKAYVIFEYAKIIDENQIELILGEQDNIIPDYSNTIIIKILESEHYYFYAIVPYNENGALSNLASVSPRAFGSLQPISATFISTSSIIAILFNK
jgi:hypothetical protein